MHGKQNIKKKKCNSYCFSTAKIFCTNAPERCVIHTLPVLFTIHFTRSAMRSKLEHRQIVESAPKLWYGARCVINENEQVEKTSKNLRIVALLGCCAGQIDSYLWTFRDLSVATLS